MIKHGLAIMAALAAYAGVARAETPAAEPGFYARAYGGLSTLNDSDISTGGANANAKFSSGLMVGGTFGYDYAGPWLLTSRSMVFSPQSVPNSSQQWCRAIASHKQSRVVKSDLRRDKHDGQFRTRSTLSGVAGDRQSGDDTVRSGVLSDAVEDSTSRQKSTSVTVYENGGTPEFVAQEERYAPDAQLPEPKKGNSK